MSEIKSVWALRTFSNSPRLSNEQRKEVLNIANAIEAEISERYIKLPTDKNGYVIHVGDMVKHADGDVYEVLGVDNDGARQGVFINTGEGKYPIDSWCASGMELYKPRTLEDVIEGAINAAFGNEAPFSDIAKKAADEIRELFGGDAS